MGAPWSLLVVDDSADAANLVRAALEGHDVKVLTAQTVPDAVSVLLDAPVSVVVVKHGLPNESGLSIVQFLQEKHLSGPQVPVAMLCAGLAQRLEGFAVGADDCLELPIESAELSARLLRLRSLYERLKALDDECRRLLELSLTDGLTNLSNHRAFQERLRDEFRRAQRYDDPLALILIDVDHFKLVNDQHGHQAGDEVLRILSATMREAVRETDFVARYGGEEFAVLLPKTHLAGALTVAERISLDFRQKRIGEKHLRVTASFGVSSFPGRAVNSPELLLRTADEALFRSKREGRNKISIYQASAPIPLQS